ncbi:hypothetical protein HB961_11255 [Listeria welshimeri]|nr:hypothetical protein [Listeria welshimeri]MBC1693302.1 hypothetical protein [Listeria welshimeri]
MTKEWDTKIFDNFHSTMKKYTKNTLTNLNTISKKQQTFGATKKGMESRTFEGARAYVNEVHPSIINSITRALDEYIRVVGKLGDDFEGMVDSAGVVIINTDMINQLNKETDRKVEDIYQAHAELQKQIDVCNSDSTTMPVVAPLFGPLETTTNTVRTYLNEVKNNIDDYDSGHKDALNSYHQLVSAIRKAIDAARTNYTSPNGAIRYTSGAFGSSPEGIALINANYQLEKTKMEEIYKTENGKLLNMENYINELLQDPDRLERELDSILYLLSTQNYKGDKGLELRCKLNTLYTLLSNLKVQMNRYEGDTKDFKVMNLSLSNKTWDKYELKGTYQTCSKEDWDKQMGPYKDTYGNKYRLIDFTVFHYGNEYTILEDISADDVKELQQKMDNNNANWIIPIIETGVGSIPVIGTPLTTGVGVAEALTEDEQIKQQIKVADIKATANLFKMTLTKTTIHQNKPAEDIVNLSMQPTQETKDILSRWEEVSSRKSKDGKGKNSFPKDGKLNYVDLAKKFNQINFGSENKIYITEGK